MGKHAFNGKWQEDENFAKNVTKVSLEHYNLYVPQKGKAQQQNKEWTLLSTIVLSIQHQDSYELIITSLGTGTKSIGHNLMSKDGKILNDSHAEVIARRSLLLFLYDQIQHQHKHSNSLIFDTVTTSTAQAVQQENNTSTAALTSSLSTETKISMKPHQTLVKLKENVHFHMYLSQSPCGDASIIQQSLDTPSSSDPTCNVDVGSKRKREQEIDSKTDITQKKKKQRKNKQEDGEEEGEEQLHTGAKYIPEGYKAGDTLPSEDLDNQLINVVRLKPGRGVRSLSMSCADKITKWNVVGLQGSLLSLFIENPVRLSTITLHMLQHPHNALYMDSLKRCLHDRLSTLQEQIIPTSTPSSFLANTLHLYPKLLSCVVDEVKDPQHMIFQDRKQANSISACGFSTNYHLRQELLSTKNKEVITKEHEVTISHRGIKQGITKKLENSEKAISRLAKIRLFEQFTKTLVLVMPERLQTEQKSYGEWKEAATQEAVVQVKKAFKSSGVFKNWIQKSKELEQFRLDTK